MKRVIVLLIMMVPLLTATAQITHDARGSHDGTADEILKKAAARFDKSVGFTATVTMTDGSGRQTMQQSARVVYSKGRYRIEAGDQELLSDGKTVWQWNKSTREVMVTAAEGSEDNLLNPAQLLAHWDKQFRAKYIRTEPDGTAVIDLQPRSAHNYHKIRLMVVEKSGLLRRMEVHRFDSGREVYEISGFKNVSATDSQFVFDEKKHTGVEIIDMR